MKDENEEEDEENLKRNSQTSNENETKELNFRTTDKMTTNTKIETKRGMKTRRRGNAKTTLKKRKP